jgi:hypothetical protein
MNAAHAGILSVMMMAYASFAQAQQPIGARESIDAKEVAAKLTGTWRLLSVETIRPNGEILTEWMGRNPTGLIIYHANGLVAVQIMREPRPKFQSGSRLEATTEEIKAAYLGYYAYWGKYTINVPDNTIVHNVEASLWPEEVGIANKRYFAFDGSRLVLTTTPFRRAGEERRNRLVWERIQ